MVFDFGLRQPGRRGWTWDAPTLTLAVKDLQVAPLTCTTLFPSEQTFAVLTRGGSLFRSDQTLSSVSSAYDSLVLSEQTLSSVRSV